MAIMPNLCESNVWRIAKKLNILPKTHAHTHTCPINEEKPKQGSSSDRVTQPTCEKCVGKISQILHNLLNNFNNNKLNKFGKFDKNATRTFRIAIIWQWCLGIPTLWSILTYFAYEVFWYE